MASHAVGTQEAWRAARLELLEAEKDLTRRSDDVAEQRRQLPWVRVEKDYRFETERGRITAMGRLGHGCGVAGEAAAA